MKAKPTPTGGLTTPAKFHRFGKSFETRVDALSAKPPLTSPRSTTNERRQANVGGEARRRVRVFWPEEDAWFAGFVGSYDWDTKKHTVYYDDGEVERIVLADEKVEWLEPEPAADGSASSPATPSLLGLKALQAMGARVREEDVTKTVTEEQAKAGGGFYRTKAGKLRCGRCRSCVIKSYKRPCFMLLRPDEKEARAGRRVSVLWPDENRRFTGVIDGYNADDDVHTIAYDDGTVEHHVLADEDVHFIERRLPSPNPDARGGEEARGEEARRGVLAAGKDLVHRYRGRSRRGDEAAHDRVRRRGSGEDRDGEGES
jgi:hypothetical protein